MRYLEIEKMNTQPNRYLKMYNALQLSGWGLALIFLFFNIDTAYAVIALFQVFSLLEIFHAKKKWVSSSPLFCTLQIVARLLILFFVLLVSVQVWGISNNVFLFNRIVVIMFFVWCIAEVIRYAYYLSEVMMQDNKSVTWLRYHAFIVCYPVGLLCELYILGLTLLLTSSIGLKILILIIFLAYVIAFPMLYLHLLKQRDKKIVN
jgi:very-long-chain (3R)-3-hydroxyacyl-CoA dehydratase